MNRKEVVQIAQLISNSYPNATFSKEKLETWAEMLDGFDYETVRKNAKYHILHSEYSPTIADLVKVPKHDEPQTRSNSTRTLEDVEKAKREAAETLRKLGVIK